MTRFGDTVTNGNIPDQLPDAMICDVLKRYSAHVTPTRVELPANRSGFSGAAIWRVVSEEGTFALRRWPDSGLNRERIGGLHRLLEHIRNEGLSFVAVPLKTDDGTTLLRLHSHDWQLEQWMPGVADYHERPSPERIRATMSALAQWHLAAQRFVPQGPGTEWFLSCPAAPSPAIRERLSRLELVNSRILSLIERAISQQASESLRHLSMNALKRFRLGRQAISADLRLLESASVRLQPCLRDVWHDHVLFVDDEVTGLIDPSACRTESVSSDLSRLIGSMVGDDRDAWDFALSEYQRHRPLSVNELALVGVLDRSGVLLSGWTWLEWIYAQRRPFPDVKAVANRLEEIVNRMDRLFDNGSPDAPNIVFA